MEDTTQELRNYQLSYLLPSSMTGENCARAREELMKTLQEQDTHIVQSSELSKRKLAYPMAKQTFAFAGKIVFLAQPHTIPSLNASLRREEGLLRFIVVKKEEAEIPSGRSEERFAQQHEGARNESKERTEPLAANVHRDETTTEQSAQNKEEMPRKDREKITIEDVDRKLDEIMKNIQ